MEDRRFFRRVDLELRCNLYLKERRKGENEFIGTLLDVSEEGMKVCIDKKEYRKVSSVITEGTELDFQAVDRVGICGAERMCILQGSARVLRVEEIDGRSLLGCKVYPGSASYDEFVRSKKVSIFLQEFHGRKKEY